jgi:hypothetical protein
VDRILKPVAYVLAVLYILIDAVFMTVAKLIGDWIAKRLPLRELCAWIRSLRPYPSLALFSVPVIILEPVKPAAAYLAATGQFAKSAFMLIMGELLKLVLIERLFRLTRDKLMKISAFAWTYSKFCEVKAWLESTEAWRTMRRLRKVARDWLAGVTASVMHSPYWAIRMKRASRRGPIKKEIPRSWESTGPKNATRGGHPSYPNLTVG